MKNLFDSRSLSDDMQKKIQRRAIEIINLQRNVTSINSVKKIMQQYDLSNDEGIALMCLAEALLRIPDNKTIDRLLEDKFTSVDWKEHTGFDKGVFVNASSWAFFLTGNILEKNELDKTKLEETYKGFIKKTSESSS